MSTCVDGPVPAETRVRMYLPDALINSARTAQNYTNRIHFRNLFIFGLHWTHTSVRNIGILNVIHHALCCTVSRFHAPISRTSYLEAFPLSQVIVRGRRTGVLDFGSIPTSMCIGTCVVKSRAKMHAGLQISSCNTNRYLLCWLISVRRLCTCPVL